MMTHWYVVLRIRLRIVLWILVHHSMLPFAKKSKKSSGYSPVRYILGLKRRLISVGQIDEEGYHVGFGDQQWKVTKAIDGRGNAALWHQRLGCMSEKGMKILALNGRIPDLQKAVVGFCEPCVLGKQNKVSFVKYGNTRKLHRLELVHTDVYDPTSVASIGGFRYYVTFIDDNSMKNGVAKRMNRTLNERAKSMRLHAATTTYLINREPFVPLGFRILEEEWQGKEVSLAHLRVFGCDSYVKVKDVARDKLNAKSMKCTFIGYGSDEMGYRFWDSKSHKVVQSRDVIFNDDSLYGAKAATDSSKLTNPNQKDQVVLEDSPENLTNKSIVVEHGLSLEITQSPCGSSNTNEGSKIVGASRIVEAQMKKTLKKENSLRRKALRLHKASGCSGLKKSRMAGKVTPSDIQYSAAKRFEGVTDWHLEPRFIENQGADEELSDGGSSRFIVYGYDGLLMLPVALPSPDYIPRLEEPQTPPAPQDEDEHKPMFIQPHDSDFVPEPIYPEYIPREDEHILPAEEQPLPPIVSPTVESPGYVAESDPEEDPEEYEDDETEDGPVDYPMDGGDDGDDDDGDSSGNDADDEDEDEEDLAPADSAIIIPTDELVAPPKGTEHVIPPPSTDTDTIKPRIPVRLQAVISFPPEAKVERLLVMPTLLPSPLTSLSPPSAGERLARCMAPAALPSPPLPSPLHMPPPIDCRDDIPDTEMPPHKRLCLSTLGSMYEVEESFTTRLARGRGIDYGFVSTLDAKARRREIGEVGYGIRDTWIDPAETVYEIAPMTVRDFNTRVTELVELHEHDTQDLYALLEDAQDSRTRISQRVAVDSQWVDLLMKDMIAHQDTIQIVEDEAYVAREAWAHSIGLSQAVHSKLQTHQEHMQQNEIAELQETDRRHQAQMAETLRVIGDMRREMGDMQAEFLALREQPRRAG
nr:hypothetical protein [Tanacetum cinerariifolium]